MSSGSFLLARDRLVEQVGPGPRPGWWLLLDALAPGHPELLETRGSWSTLADLTLENVRAHAYLFLTGPLRLAVLTNTDDTQASHLRTALQRWIQPINRHGARCSRQQAPEV